VLSRHKAAVAAVHVESILQEMGEPSDAHPGYKTAELSAKRRLRALEQGEQEQEIERRLQTRREQLRSR